MLTKNLNKRGKFLPFLLILGSLAFFAGCGSDDTTDPGVTGDTGDTVTLSSISVTPQGSTLIAGQSLQFTATGTYSDSSTQDITSSVSWSSPDNSGYATIGSGGLVTGIKVGNLTISASDSASGISGSAILTVASSYTPEGNATGFPVSLTYGASPYSGQVDTTSSYYVISGLTVDSYYNLAVTNPSDSNISIHLCSDTSYTSCGMNIGFDSAIDPSAGTIYVKISGDLTDAGASYTLNIIPRALGSVVSPAVIAYPAGLPIIYTVDTTSSYFQLNGLIAGTNYTYEITGLTGNADLYVYSDTGFSTLICSSMNTGSTTESCSGKTTTTSVYIKIDGSNSLYGAEYTLDVIPPSSEGTDTAPIPIAYATDLPYLGSVATLDSSYYKVTGLTASTTYVFSFTGMTANTVALDVYSIDFTLGNRDCAANPVNNEVFCTVTTDAAETEFFVKALDLNQAEGSTFQLKIKLLNSVDFASLPYSGSVGTTDTFIKITGLSATDEYTFILYNLNDNADLFITSDDTFSTTTVSSERAGTLDEAGYFSASDTFSYVRIKGNKTSSGTSFMLKAVQNPISQGSAGAPLSISLPYSGAVNNSVSSFYKISGTLPGNTYRIQLTEISGDIAVAYLHVYSDVNFTTLLCETSHSSISDACMITAPGTDYYVKISSSSPNATFYTLSQAEENPNLLISIDNVTGDGSKVIVDYTITNNGLGMLDISYFSLKFWADSATQPTQPEIEALTGCIDYIIIPELSPGESFSGSMTDFSSTLVTGNAYLAVDAQKYVPESDETDNLSAAFSW
ncbi:MAG: Ig-like domain-containing protein [Spirochaetia bacterium]|nr:Ig-like domain-containing protein [Spirochaetia bacterium]